MSAESGLAGGDPLELAYPEADTALELLQPDPGGGEADQHVADERSQQDAADTRSSLPNAETAGEAATDVYAREAAGFAAACEALVGFTEAVEAANAAIQANIFGWREAGFVGHVSALTLPPQDVERSCPRCAEFVKRAAIICRFCGRDVTPMESTT